MAAVVVLAYILRDPRTTPSHDKLLHTIPVSAHAYYGAKCEVLYGGGVYALITGYC